MTDDPFADLGETLEDEPDDQTDAQEASASANGSATASADSDDDSIREADPLEDAAFSYEAAQQRPFYAREETIDDFDSWLNYELERELNERGYQNIVVRELTDALLRTVVEEDLIDAVAERFEGAREDAISE